MSWKIIEKHRRRLAAETGSVRKHGGSLSVCLVYPNRYCVGMSNLGFQTVYLQLNSHPDIACERAFLPDADELAEYRKSRTPLLSLEFQRPLADFDVIAFSVSFESDYLHIPTIFDLAGMQPLATDRSESSPLVIGGGAALFLNPEPVADFLDVIAVGESEPILPALLHLLLNGRKRGKEERLQLAARLPGIYIPSLYRIAYDGPIVNYEPVAGAPAVVTRVWERKLDEHATASVVFCPESEFSGMHLVEVSRGCPRGCRFCAAGFIYAPYRQRSLERMKEEVDKGLEQQEKVGLVGAAVGDFHGIGELSRHIIERGGKLSVSSLRIDSLDDAMIDALKSSGHKTVALAPEGGSQRLRDLVEKNISEQQILQACDRLIARDILNLKLYFIIGLPTETMADLEEMVSLVGRIRERVVSVARTRGRLGEIILSVNPFVPKPFTPFQWCGMEEMKSLERKVRFLHDAVRPLSNVRLQVESLKEAYVQALLSRGDRRLARLLVRAAQAGLKKAARELELDLDRVVLRTIPLDEPLPWRIIDGAAADRLKQEYRKAFAAG